MFQWLVSATLTLLLTGCLGGSIGQQIVQSILLQGADKATASAIDVYKRQTVGFRATPHQHATPAYQRWQEAVRNYQQASHTKTAIKHGAIWMAYYPLLMVEWYPNVLVVSHIIPQGVDACMNVVEFYYPEDIALFESEYVAAQKAAYHETAIEDQDICQRMHDGRRALFAQELDERGPYQHPMDCLLYTSRCV